MDLIKENETDTNECVTIIPCYTKEDINKREGFKFEFTYQIFGEDETLYGYDNLKIFIFYIPQIFKFHIKCLQTSNKDTKSILEKFKENTIVDYCEEEEFLGFFDSFTPTPPLGRVLEEFKINDEEYTINYVEDLKEAKEFHKAYHFFAIGYIEGANEIDLEDESWRFVICYKKIKLGSNIDTFDLVGVYSLYLFKILEKIRPRISVAFVLPPFRRSGVASKMLSSIYSLYCQKTEVIDICVETPVDEFQAMRHSVDCRLISRVNGCKEIFDFCSKNNKFDIDQFRKAYKDFVDLNTKNYKFNRQQRLKVFILLSFIYAKRKKVCEDVVYQFFLKKMKLKKKGPKDVEDDGDEQLMNVVNYFREIAFKIKIDL